MVRPVRPERLHTAAMPIPTLSLVCIVALLAAGALAGCAATNEARQHGGSGPETVPQQAIVPQQSQPQPLALPPVQLAAFEQQPASPPQPIPLPPDGLVPTEVVPAPRPETDQTQSLPLDLATALGLTQGQNPRIAFTQAQIAQAYAQYEAARVLWLPSLRAGMNYNKHEGRLQNVEGDNREISRGAAFGGLGASAVGAASPAVPGVLARFHLSEAIYQPRIAGAALQAREQLGNAVINDQLLATALAYLELLEAMQRLAIAGETLRNGEELSKLTAEFARTGAGNQADADRAAAALALFRNETVRAEDAVEIASARLAQRFSADPTLRIVPQEPTMVPIDLVPANNSLPDLVAIGLSNRPELSADRSLVDEAVSRLRREEHAPWLPSIVLGLSYGAFAAGRNGDITRGADRFDFDAIAWWEVRNLGFGERAARDSARAQIRQARMREVESMDLVAREVVEAYADAADRRPIDIAKEGITFAQQSYERNLNRIRNAQGLPIEVLQSIQALDAARREYLRSLIEYNSAQFRLQRALGWPVAAP